MRLSTAIAADSQARASSTAASGSSAHGCDRSRSGMSFASVSGSASPAQGSSAVKRAMLQALATVSRSASSVRSAVLAAPFRVPKYTVTPIPRSRWYSTVSTSPSRTDTERPTSTLTAASDCSAPRAFASRSATSTSASRSGPRAGGAGVCRSFMRRDPPGCSAILAVPAAQPLRASISRVRPPDDDPDEAPSKSARKREALDLQSLGEALIELPPAELDALDLPETLHDAIVAARDITSRGAGVRQRQFIGKLMRKVDTEPIRAALERRRDADRARLRSERHIEQWRDRLLTDDAAVWQELQSSHLDAPVDELRSLVRQARAERDSARPPAAARRLFRRLRELLDPGL